jgi:hypothetical protein
MAGTPAFSTRSARADREYRLAVAVLFLDELESVPDVAKT